MQMLISSIINDLLNSKNTNVSQLAKIGGVTEGTIRNYLNKNSVPDIKFLIKISEHFGITDFNYWLTGREAPRENVEELHNKIEMLQDEIKKLQGRIEQANDTIRDLTYVKKPGDGNAGTRSPTFRVTEGKGQKR